MSVRTPRQNQVPPHTPHPDPGSSSTPPRRRHRFLRVVAAGALVVLALLLIGAVTNIVLEQIERRTVPSYGDRVAVTDGELNVYQHGDSGPTIVLLSGYGTPAPALDFAPLIRELDGYRIVVVEGFGYGYSDTEAPQRSVENIASELHQALTAIHIDEPYVLVGHSIAGIYDLYYANRYPDEVAAVIGIDASLPGQINGLAGQGNPVIRLVSATGLLRVASALAPSLVEPPGTAYTAGEREQIRMLTNWNWANPAILDEANQGERNFTVVKDLTYPRDIPVLSFIKKKGNQAHWRELHQEQLQNQDTGELVELDGGHYLHWTHARELAEKINQFLSKTVGTQ